MEVTLDTTQIASLKEFFNGLSNADQRKLFLTAFRKASTPMVRDAKAGLTTSTKTGNLMRSIGTVGLSGEIAILVGAKKGGGYKGWHGHLIENGTVMRYRRSKGNAPTGKVTGIHFMENAYNSNEDYMIDSVEQEWLQAIDKLIYKINTKNK